MIDSRDVFMFQIDQIISVSKQQLIVRELCHSSRIPIEGRCVISNGNERFTECNTACARTNLEELKCRNADALAAEIRKQLRVHPSDPDEYDPDESIGNGVPQSGHDLVHQNASSNPN